MDSLHDPNAGDQFPDARWCDYCGQWHGRFFICLTYSQEVKDEIMDAARRHREMVFDPVWVRQQREAGKDDMAIGVIQLLAESLGFYHEFETLEDCQENDLVKVRDDVRRIKHEDRS